MLGKRLARVKRSAYDLSSRLRRWYLNRIWGMDLGRDLKMSWTAKLDKTNPRGIHIGDSTLVSFDAAILSHDFVNNKHVDTWIGSNCFIGARSIIMPGVRIGDHCIIGAGSVVNIDVPSHAIAAGNPAKIIRTDIVTGRWGIRAADFLEVEAKRMAAEAGRA